MLQVILRVLFSTGLLLVGMTLIGGGIMTAGGEHVRPQPGLAFVVFCLGLVLVLLSYLPVKRLRAEIALRVAIYIVLLGSSVGIIGLVYEVIRFGWPPTPADRSFFVFKAVIRSLSLAALWFFYRWAGLRDRP